MENLFFIWENFKVGRWYSNLSYRGLFEFIDQLQRDLHLSFLKGIRLAWSEPNFLDPKCIFFLLKVTYIISLKN